MEIRAVIRGARKLPPFLDDSSYGRHTLVVTNIKAYNGFWLDPSCIELELDCETGM